MGSAPFVRRRCDCLASSAPFTNIQTYLLTYLLHCRISAIVFFYTERCGTSGKLPLYIPFDTDRTLAFWQISHFLPFGSVDSIPVSIHKKAHTLDIAPLRSESPPQKRSGMARVLKGFHSFTCKPTRSSAIGMSHTCLCLPSRSWFSFADPQRDGRLSRPWCEVAPAEI